MITVFARDYSTPNIQSAYWQETPAAAFLGGAAGESWYETAFDPQLTLVNDGLSFSTWIKPDWNATLQGAPVLFTGFKAAGGVNNTIWTSYDAETEADALYISVVTNYDGVTYTASFFAPLATDAFNAAITGLSPNLVGPGGVSRNSWNATSLPQFVNLTFLITDMAPGATNQGDLSVRARIFWNGQYLRTYEQWTGNANWFTLDGFRTQHNKFQMGNIFWPRNYWMDKTSMRLDNTAALDVNTHYYAAGSPTSPTIISDLHYDFESTGPLDSNGPIQLSVTNIINAPAFAPIIQSGIGV